MIKIPLRQIGNTHTCTTYIHIYAHTAHTYTTHTTHIYYTAIPITQNNTPTPHKHLYTDIKHI